VVVSKASMVSWPKPPVAPVTKIMGNRDERGLCNK
jgi:hypothetical protein